MPGYWSLAEIEAVLRDCWDGRTCDPALDWDAGNPAAGHCGVTSMAVHELFGGVLLWADVYRDAESLGCLHYWNRLPGGLEIDLTREQFRLGERLGSPVVQEPVRSADARMATRYHRYAARVRARLGGSLPAGIPGLA